MKRGTLPFDQLQRLTALPARFVRDALTILSLHDCLHHARPLKIGGLELYEINEDGLERRLRGGRYAQMALERGGKEWRTIIETCWREGIAHPREMAKDIVGPVKATKMEEEGANGAAVDLEEGPAKDKSGADKGKARAKSSKRDASDMDELNRAFVLIYSPLSLSDSTAHGLIRCFTSPGAEKLALTQIGLAHASGLLAIVTDGSRSSADGLNTKWETDLRKNIKGEQAIFPY